MGSQGMTTTIEGDIKSAYDNVNHKILMNFLKKKICDRNFLRLIKKGLEQEIILKNQKKVGMLGVPQGGIASSILFNIYMHEFDQMVEEKVGELLKKNNKRREEGPWKKGGKKKKKKKKKV